jgi:hypothetical protein
MYRRAIQMSKWFEIDEVEENGDEYEDDEYEEDYDSDPDDECYRHPDCPNTQNPECCRICREYGYGAAREWMD